MTNLEDIEVEITDLLQMDPEDADGLINALQRTRVRLGEAGTQIPLLVESNQLILYWHAVAADRRRGATEKRQWQFVEDYLGAAVKGMNTSIIASLGLIKKEKFDGGV